MARTRGQQPAATTGKANPVEKTAESDRDRVVRLDVPNNDYHAIDEGGTIGSRLRKRRRTASPHVDEPHVYDKHSTMGKSSSPESKHSNAGTSTCEVSVPSQPISNGEQTEAREQAFILANQMENTPPETVRLGQEPPDKLANLLDPKFLQYILEQAEASTNGEASASAMRDSDWNQLSSKDPVFKNQILALLESTAEEILRSLAKSSQSGGILSIAKDSNPDSGSRYSNFRHLFDGIKKIISHNTHFLDPYKLGSIHQSDIDIYRKANLATFVSSIFGSQDVGFYHLNENFLHTFVADGNRLLKSQAQLYLDLKTQCFISAVTIGLTEEDPLPPEDLLEELFPVNLEEFLLSRRPGAKQLAPSELDFLQRARNRRRSLLEESDCPDAINALPQKYSWDDFLREVGSYVSKNFETIVGTSTTRKPARGRPSNVLEDQNDRQESTHSQDARHQNGNHTQLDTNGETQNGASMQLDQYTDEIAEKAAREAHEAMAKYTLNQDQHLDQMPQQTQPVPPVPPIQPAQQPAPIQYHWEHHQPPAQHQIPPQYFHPPVNGNGEMVQHQQMYGEQNAIPYPTQTAPTQILYERARMAATAKASPTNRRAGTPSQRRPWTTEEENALMAGLDRVKGPHWSQILAMFGPGGTINESLKDRNQVQLKDKARNLKLFFLKSGIEVPYYLSFVTGELKTRAPAQAAKNEAKARQGHGEDRAHVEGVMTLAEAAGHHEAGANMSVMNSVETNGTVPAETASEMGSQSHYPQHGLTLLQDAAAHYGDARGPLPQPTGNSRAIGEQEEAYEQAANDAAMAAAKEIAAMSKSP